MHVLLSYHHFRDRPDVPVKLAGLGVKVLVDSGAFSAFTNGHVITVEDYGKYLKEIHDKVEGCFTLDVVDDPEATRENHLELKGMGYRPIPVWQSHDHQFPGLTEFLEDETYVAIGALVRTADQMGTRHYNERRIAAFMRLVPRSIRVHLLGFSSEAFLKRVHPYSCDSSRGKEQFRFGANAPLFDPVDRVWVKVPFKGRQPMRGEDIARVRRTLRMPEWSPGDMSQWESDGGFNLGRGISMAGTMSFYRFVRQLGGPFMYMALVNVNEVVSLLEVGQVAGWIPAGDLRGSIMRRGQ